LKEITQVGRELGLGPEDLKVYGKWKAKISLDSIYSASESDKGKLILVTAMNPTPSGEGKTVTTIGLSMALNQLGRKAIACIRQPSLGPVFGVKGGAAGGGKCTVEPMQEINLRFTGDIDAVGAAHNLLAAMLDNHIFQSNDLGFDIHSVNLRRVIDMNDRALRQIVIGLGSKIDGIPREAGFVITAASEVMAVLCMSKGYSDLKQRLGRMIVGYKSDSVPIRASQLKAEGAMAALLKEAMEPNLVQTSEETPAVIHGGPFGNIALGTCSLSSIRFGLGHSEFTVVEAGFGSDLGGEKFFDIVSRVGGFNIDCAVIVVTVKALEYHGGMTNKSGAITPESRKEFLLRGLENLGKHIENVQSFGVEPVVCINKFTTDKEDELQAVRSFSAQRKVPCEVSTGFDDGGAGCLDLARQVVSQSERGFKSGAIYSFQESIETKIEKIVKKIYGGKGVEYSPDARKAIALIERLGFSNLPICMAKTPLSLSDDPKKLGRPVDFTCLVKRLELATGAGYIIAHLGEIVSMPGLPERPSAENIDIDEKGNITGIF
jgi:formate--tetrahydrofolate ligase